MPSCGSATGSSTSTPSCCHASRIASAPLSRTHAASVAVIGVADSTVTGGSGAVSGTSSISLRPNRNAVNGAESHSGVSRSINASGSSIRPSTAGAAARIAMRAGEAARRPPAQCDDDLGARAVQRIGHHLGRVEHRMARTAKRHIVTDAVASGPNRSTSMCSVPRNVTLASSGSAVMPAWAKCSHRCARTSARTSITRTRRRWRWRRSLAAVDRRLARRFRWPVRRWPGLGAGGSFCAASARRQVLAGVGVEDRQLRGVERQLKRLALLRLRLGGNPCDELVFTDP